ALGRHVEGWRRAPQLANGIVDAASGVEPRRVVERAAENVDAAVVPRHRRQTDPGARHVGYRQPHRQVGGRLARAGTAVAGRAIGRNEARAANGAGWTRTAAIDVGFAAAEGVVEARWNQVCADLDRERVERLRYDVGVRRAGK